MQIQLCIIFWKNQGFGNLCPWLIIPMYFIRTDAFGLRLESNAKMNWFEILPMCVDHMSIWLTETIFWHVWSPGVTVDGVSSMCWEALLKSSELSWMIFFLKSSLRVVETGDVKPETLWLAMPTTLFDPKLMFFALQLLVLLILFASDSSSLKPCAMVEVIQQLACLGRQLEILGWLRL